MPWEASARAGPVPFWWRAGRRFACLREVPPWRDGGRARRRGISTLDICPKLDRIARVRHGREVVNQALQQAKGLCGVA